jgi:hypothetical protein
MAEQGKSENKPENKPEVHNFEEGFIRRGGLNQKPTSPRPPDPPKGQQPQSKDKK